jgi:hypothetical protein
VTAASRSLVLCILLVGGCEDHPKAGGPGLGEQAYIENEVRSLEAALAAKDETKIAVGCMSVTTGSKDRMPAALQRKIEQLCYVEAPRFQLEHAIADVTKARAENPSLPPELTCMQLFASDAFKAMAKLPTPDPGVAQLAHQYEQLCPEAVAKIRARAGSGAP